jgi:hypothetical protein
MKPIAWYDPTNGAVSTDKDSPLFTPLGQVWPLFLEEQQITADCPNCEYHRKRAQRWREEAYKLSGHPLPEREKYEPYAFEASMYSNDRIKIDPVTGNVSIGTPQQEAKDEPVPENFIDALRFDVAMREWVGLTDEERNQLWRDVVKWGDPSHDDVDLMKAIEAKLKERNA